MNRTLKTALLALAALLTASAPTALVYTTLNSGVAQAAETATMEVYRTSDSSLDNLLWTVGNLNCEEAGDQADLCEQSRQEARSEMGL